MLGLDSGEALIRELEQFDQESGEHYGFERLWWVTEIELKHQILLRRWGQLMRFGVWAWISRFLATGHEALILSDEGEREFWELEC